MMNREEFMALHRHWMWANVIKKHLEQEILVLRKSGRAPAPGLLADRYGAYMSIWYGMLYGVLEAMRKRQVALPGLQEEVDSIYGSLRLYRNAVFHPQPQYFSKKLHAIMDDPESPKKIWAVHAGLGGFFLEELGRIKAGRPGKWVKPEKSG